MSKYEIDLIRKNASKLDSVAVVKGNILLGFSVEVPIKMKNHSDEILDQLNAFVEIRDLDLKERQEQRLGNYPAYSQKRKEVYRHGKD